MVAVTDIDRELAEIDARLEMLLPATCGGETLPEFIGRVSPHLPPPKHLDPLIGLLERVRVERIKAVLTMPPGHIKTTTILHALAWMVDRNPVDTNAYVTYAKEVAGSKSRICRSMARDAGVFLETENLSEWRTAAGGGLLATGINGALTSQRVTGVLVIDDPYKNREQADSAAWQRTVDDFYREVAITRLEHASIIVVHTRWRQDDLAGACIAKGWECINLPAIAEADDPIGRKPGEALWPKMYPLKYLEEQRQELGEWSFQALYQGQPRPKGHALFGAPPTFYDPKQIKMEGIIYVAGDPAASDSTRADHSVGIAILTKGFGADRRAYVLGLIRGQWTVPAYARAVHAFQKGYRGAPVGIEAVAGFKSVGQILRELEPGLNVIDLFPVGDKFQRAQAVAQAWNTGRILLPVNQPWTGPLVTELQKFTGIGDEQDDQVDALAHAWNMGLMPIADRGAKEAVSRWR